MAASPPLTTSGTPNMTITDTLPTVTPPATPVSQQLPSLRDLLVSEIGTDTHATASRVQAIIQRIHHIVEENPSYVTPQAITPLVNILSSASPLLLQLLVTHLELILGYSISSPVNESIPSSHAASQADITTPTPTSDPQTVSLLLAVTDRISIGIRSFLARGGRTTSYSSFYHDTPEPLPKRRKGSSSRSSQQRSRCRARDKQFCVVTGSPDNLEVAHIIPFSVGVANAGGGSRVMSLADSPTLDSCFWAFVEMFLGRLKTTALRDRFSKLDVVENMLLLCGSVHSYFGAGRIALIPQMEESEFDSATTTEYSVTVDFPKHTDKGSPNIVKEPASPTSRTVERILNGDTLTLRTDDCSTRPLPHPALLSLHAIISRVVAARGASGIATYRVQDDYSDTEIWAEDGSRSYNDSDDDDYNELDGDGKTEWVAEWIGMTSPPTQASTTWFSETFDDGERPRAVETIMGEKTVREIERGIMLV